MSYNSEPYTFEIAAGILLYRVGLDEKILPQDLVRAVTSRNRWSRIYRGYSHWQGWTIPELNKLFRVALDTEVLREYI